ncbi:NADH dehydrogenase [ubiquinone] 1 alpha subcomplex subunit 11-like [Argiope bruennichi]|uniref:NADH dehydrogenase [ubiquinone] 1 alpha subcomplex subunit 11 n=1 Tax=Argiope bruennichi TaxID=94029 RepID=A0A8T0EHE7_ARGBR|nr:NADH dehydrogenase [ubiquinone] 1 alpha subcomplex subunit 11-like [Argiope bruennichi]KAF8773210.1 NADH dehydrogenase 1 alpha like protein [Argiope bruennichi]
MVIHTKKFKDYVHYYDFFATPDGQDCLPKTYYYTKYGAIGGAIFSIYEMALVSRPTTFYSTVARFGHFTFPFAGMGFVFGSSICILGQMRKKDDTVNHFIGGALAGAVWGLKYNRIQTGHVMGLFVGFMAAYFKYFHVHNIPLFNMRGPETIRSDPRYDFTIKVYDDPGRPIEA